MGAGRIAVNKKPTTGAGRGWWLRRCSRATRTRSRAGQYYHPLETEDVLTPFQHRPAH